MARTRACPRKSTGYRIPRRKLSSETAADISDVKEILKEYNEKLLQNNNKEKDLNERYRNDEPLVKVWISQDQKNKKIVKEENDKITLQKQLKELTLDLKYEIISFIPTYSNTYSLTNKLNVNKMTEQVLNGSLHSNNPKTRDREEDEIKKEKMIKVVETLLEPNNVKEECKFTMDSKLITFHKMRLINKEFNRRMKLKILTLNHLDLDFILLEGTSNISFKTIFDDFALKRLKLWGLMNLLKHQRLYKEYKENYNKRYCNELANDNSNHFMETILQLDYIGLYDYEQLNDFFNQDNSSNHHPGSLGNIFGTTPVTVFTNNTTTDTLFPAKKVGHNDTNSDTEINVMTTVDKEENKKYIDVNSLDIFELSNEDLNNLESQLTNEIKQESLQPTDSQTNLKPTHFNLDESTTNLEELNHYSNTQPVASLITGHYYPFPSNLSLKPKITEFIGENTTIESIQFNYNLFSKFLLRPDLKLMLNCLKKLTTINLINYNEMDSGHFSNLPSVKEVNLIFIENYGFNFVTNLIPSPLIQQFENLERINIFPVYNHTQNDLNGTINSGLQSNIQNATVNNSFVLIERNPMTNENIIHYQQNNNLEDDTKRKIEINFTLLHNFRKEDWIWLTTTYLQNGGINSEIISSGFLNCLLQSMDLKMKKWLLEYWIKNNYLLVEEITSYLLTDLEKKENLSITQYLIYLSNEYQNGRLFNGFKPFEKEHCLKFLKFVKFGYLYEKQITEIFSLFDFTNTHPEIISLLVEVLLFEKKNEDEMISELLQSFCVTINEEAETDVIIHLLQSLYQRKYTDIIKKILLHPICCFNNVTLNLIYLPFLLMLHSYDSYFLIKFINLLEPEEILSIKDEQENNLCQLFIYLNPHGTNDYFIMKMIEKVPELAYTKNKNGETLLHTCCLLLRESPKKVNLIYYLINDSKVPYDQCDNRGRTVKQLLEENNPSFTTILF